MSASSDIIKIVEFQTRMLPCEEFDEKLAQLIYLHFKEMVLIDLPSFKTNNQWLLTAQGWVGFIPLGDERGIALQPKVKLGNLFGMLEYAYDLKSFKLLEGHYECETMQEFYERLALILAQRFLERARNSLYRTYQEDTAGLTFVRGKIDVQTLSHLAVKSKIPCIFEEQTIDNDDNRIIYWTLHKILRSGLLTERSIFTLRKAERVFRNSVSLQQFYEYDCVDRHYNRLNNDYEILHKLSRFFLDNVGPTQNIGDHSMVPFLVDMAKLFELFVARWLEQHLDKRYNMKAQTNLLIGEKGSLKMVMDLLVCDTKSGKPLCVLDTKYKAHNHVLNDDYYQVVAYADAVGCDNAILIYPRELEYPFDEKPGNIRVKTAVFDIGADLEIAGEKLLNIILERIRGES